MNSILRILSRPLRWAEGLLYGPLWLDGSDALGRWAERLEEMAERRAEAKEKGGGAMTGDLTECHVCGGYVDWPRYCRRCHATCCTSCISAEGYCPDCEEEMHEDEPEELPEAKETP